MTDPRIFLPLHPPARAGDRPAARICSVRTSIALRERAGAAARREPVTVRPAHAADGPRPAPRSRELDSALRPRPRRCSSPSAPAAPVAALSLADGAVVADPFVPTADVVDLLRLRARQLGSGGSPPRQRRRRGLLGWRLARERGADPGRRGDAAAAPSRRDRSDSPARSRLSGGDQQPGGDRPMKLLVVRYGRALGPGTTPTRRRAFLAAAEKIAGVPGLRWKLWAYDDRERRRREHLPVRDRGAGARLGRRADGAGARRAIAGDQRHRGPLLRRRRAAERGHASARAGATA